MAFELEDTQEFEYSPLEYVIYLGAQGNHVLFDNARIREAFSKREEDLADLGSTLVSEVREAINRVFSIPEFEAKKQYIASLPRDVQDVLIFLYFQMIEKTMLVNQSRQH